MPARTDLPPVTFSLAYRWSASRFDSKGRRSCLVCGGPMRDGELAVDRHFHDVREGPVHANCWRVAVRAAIDAL